MMISVGFGRYVPQLYGRYLCPSVGTTIRNRSSHIPTHTPTEATTQPAIVRVLLRLRMISGTTKLQTTIVQKSGANEPLCVTLNTAISAGSFPYHVARRSLNPK